MRGDISDFVSRLRSVLPKRWFAENAPNLTAILTCIATPWAWLYSLLSYVVLQTRIYTATDIWLDIIALDFFGSDLKRESSESDISFRSRILRSVLRSGATRPAISASMRLLTGSEPRIFEPARCGDTGAYSTLSTGPLPPGYGLAYGTAGGWGNLSLPFQFFISITRPPTPVVGMLGGYGTDAGGYGQGSMAYVDLSQLPGQITDHTIQTNLSAILPVNTVAWLRIT